MRHRSAVALVGVVAVVVAACGTTEDEADAPSVTGDAEVATPDAPDEPATEVGPDLLIVSTVAPVADIVAQVLGERGEVHTLVPVGMDSHTYEPRPSDVIPLTEASGFIGNGLGLNPAAVELAEANLPEGAPLVLLGDEALDPDALSEDHWHAEAVEPHTHDDGEPHTHDDDEPHTHDDEPDAHEGGANPHVWTGVPNVLAYVDVVERTLTELDDDGATYYADRADRLREELTALDEAIRDAVASLPEADRKLVVYHDAWTYFGRAYGVEVIAAVQPSDYSEPSAGDVRAIIDQIRQEEVPAVFGAEEFPTSVTGTIADETGARYVGELADDTLPGEPGDPEHSYVGMMVDNVARIIDALGGDVTALEALVD